MTSLNSALTTRPRTKRIDRTLALFVGPVAAGDLIRLDSRRWRQVVFEALDLATDPRKRPDEVRLAIAQILWLADKADEIVQELFRD